MVLPKEQCAEWKKVPLLYGCNQVWMKVGGQIPWNAILIAKRQRSIIWWEDASWKTFRATFKGPTIPFGSLVEYHPITAKDQFRIHQFGKKVLPGLFLGYALVAAGNWEGWRTGCRSWGVGHDGRIGNLLEKIQSGRGDITQRKIYFSNRRWTH